MMKVALIGAGQIAKIHAPAIQGSPGVRLIAVADSDLSRAKAFALEYRIGAWHDDPVAMIKEHQPDVVHVLVPPKHHAPVAVAAMEHGCHVLVEKPMSLSRAEGEQMIAVARRRGVKICTNHNFPFEELVQEALQLVRNGAVGDVISVEASLLHDLRRNPLMLEEGAEYAHWAFGLNGGPLQDLLPHPASLIAEFIDEVNDVHAVKQSRGRLPEGWSDEIRILLKSECTLGLINVSLNERPDAMSLCIKGSMGTLTVDLYSNNLTLQRKSGLPRAVARGLSGLSLSLQHLRGSVRNIYKVASGRLDKSGGIGRLIAAFYASIRDDGPPPVSIEKALFVLDLIERVWPGPCSGTQRVSAALSRARTSVPTPSPRVLVTGASGFIGSHLLSRLLADEVPLRALVRPGSPHAGRVRRLDVEIFEGDLADKQALERATKGIEVIYHLGCVVGNDWDEQRVTTIGATETLLEAALSHGVERFVYVSTLGVCDTSAVPDGDRIAEDVPYALEVGPYARAKMDAERLVLGAYGRGLAATIVRPGIVIGPRGRVLYPHMGYTYKDRLFVIIGGGNAPLPLTYVENTVDALCKAACSDAAPGQIYHIVDDDHVTAVEYIDQLVRVAGLSSRVLKVPFPVAYLAAAGCELAATLHLLPAGMTSREQLRQKRRPVVFESSKAKSELGWQPRVPIEQGLQTTFEWYGRQHGLHRSAG